MPRDITPSNRAVVRSIVALGYRVGIGEHEGVWIATAKDDAADQFHSVKAPSEDQAVSELAISVGIELDD